VVNTLLAARPLLLLVPLVTVIWLAARVLRQSLLGRVGEAGKLAVVGALVGVYALSVIFLATGTPAPWAPVTLLLMRLTTTKVLVVLATLLMVWLLLREIPFPMPHWAGFILEGPWRRLLMPADVTLNRLALGPGMRVVEIGCGTGHLSPHVARRIQPGGVLFCVDIQPQMVEATLARVEKQGLRNLQGFAAPAGKLPFDIFDIDLVFFAHVLGEIPDRLAALRDALRVLRPGAALSITESLPDPHYRFRNDVVKLAQQAGFEPASVVGSVFNYTATFRKPKPREPLGYQPRFD
jgi:SAM-dependent methyltransferase